MHLAPFHPVGTTSAGRKICLFHPCIAHVPALLPLRVQRFPVPTTASPACCDSFVPNEVLSASDPSPYPFPPRPLRQFSCRLNSPPSAPREPSFFSELPHFLSALLVASPHSICHPPFRHSVPSPPFSIDKEQLFLGFVRSSVDRRPRTPPLAGQRLVCWYPPFPFYRFPFTLLWVVPCLIPTAP